MTDSSAAGHSTAMNATALVEQKAVRSWAYATLVGACYGACFWCASCSPLSLGTYDAGGISGVVPEDSGTDDAGKDSVGPADGGNADAGPDDGGLMDAGPPDSGLGDGGFPGDGGAGGWTSVSAGGRHTCGMRPDGTLWCWGHNTWGELGIGTSGLGAEKSFPVQVDAGTATWASTSAGGGHVCAIRSDGTLWCWGFNFNGEVGDGTTAERSSPVQVGASTDWRSVSAGAGHSCGIRSDSSLWCWGGNPHGELGNNTDAGGLTPGLVDAGTPHWASVSAGGGHTCGTRTDGTLWCWGFNFDGQLGQGTRADKSFPEQVGTGIDWVSVSAGGSHTCATQSDGSLWCWGDNSYGQLGNGTGADNGSPGQVDGGSDWTSVSAGDRHTCGTRSNGTLWCWGNGADGALGNGTSGLNVVRTTPVQVSGGATDWASVSGGGSHSCATRTDQTLWCWGANWFGQLGDHSQTDQPVPAHVR